MTTSTRPSRLFPLAIFFLLSVSVVGCGRGANGLALPTAPSGLTAPLPSASDSDEASGIELTDAPEAALSTVAGASPETTAMTVVPDGSDSAPSGLQVYLDGATFKVRGEGVVTALVPGTACPTLTFKIDEHTIKTNSATHYGALGGHNSPEYDNGACADIVVGARLDIEAITQPDGSFLAQSIRIKSKAKPPKKFRGEGVVTAVVATTACPTLTFKIGEHTIRTDSATVYEGGTCIEIVVGARLDVEVAEHTGAGIEVESTKGTGPGGTFFALTVRFKSKPKGEKFEKEGIISAVNPTMRTITVEGRQILVPMTAIIRHGDKPLAFADLKVGDRVHVRGVKNLDGYVAELVLVQETKPSVDGEATVTSLVAGTSCPTLKFKVKEMTIATDMATVYDGGTCADITVGARVRVKGSLRDDGALLATNVYIKAKSVGGGSVVSSLVPGTACPKLEFIVVGVRVHTDTDTEFVGGVCADIKPGVMVEVKGYLEPEGVHASRIQIKK